MKTTSSAAFALVASLGLLTVCGLGCNKSDGSVSKVDENWVKLMRENKAGGAGGADTGDTGTGWGTLKGKFTYNGKPAAPIQIGDIKKDEKCKVAVNDESLLVNPSNSGLSNVVIYARNVTRVTPDYAAAKPKQAVFDQRECRFLTHVFPSTLKDEFVILNTDEAAHNSNGDPGNGNEKYNKLLPPRIGKEVIPLKKATALPYDITCSIHPWMRAWHIVRPDPYVAVTNENGEFTIEKLPAGVELEFQVWHERGAAGDKGELQAEPSWSKTGRFKLKIPNDGDVVTKDVVVEPSALK